MMIYWDRISNRADFESMPRVTGKPIKTETIATAGMVRPMLAPSASQVLVENDLIDDYWIFVNPVLFGKGIPLFRPMNQLRKPRLMETKRLVGHAF
jgi:hypothetical protein